METHLYNVEFLTVETPDHPGQELGLLHPSVGVAVAAESEMDRGLISGEDLINLIKANVAEDTWEHVASLIAFQRGVLTVTNHRSVHAKIAQYLSYWRGFFGRMVSLDAAVISVDPLLLARIRSAANVDRPAILPPEHLNQLLEAAREGKLAEVLKTMRMTAHPGQRVSLQDLVKQQYLQDVDVQIATASAAISPVVSQFSTGASVDVRPFLEPFADGITLDVRADLAELVGLEERKVRITRELTPSTPLDPEPGKDAAKPRAATVATPMDPKIQLPKISHDGVRTMLTVRNRETAIAGSMLRRGRQLLFLLTPAIVSADDRPAPEPAFEEQRLLRLFDISPLTRGIQDWPGPRMDVALKSFGGPLTGATFALMEPSVQMQSSDVANMIRNRIAPDTWGNKRNSINDTQSGTLVIRQKPDVLREIDRFLTSILMARAQMITTEVVVIGLKKDARAEWEKEIPALGSGGYYVESEKFDRLFEEAARGQKVRIVDAGEVTGYPQQRVHAVRSLEEAYVAGMEPQVSTSVALHDPIVGHFTAGFVLDVRPHFIHGNEQIGVDFRSALVAVGAKEIDPLGGFTGPMQLLGGRVLNWNSNVLCVKGKYSLVALETIGHGEDSEDLVVFVRARQNVLK
ncbi:MAG TPA: hypothetical protein VKU80_02925 [Planctomycetota bacterium]|nr:hypothetical protein [Planctomycetota bacterium]